jgi:hypothetical protein
LVLILKKYKLVWLFLGENWTELKKFIPNRDHNRFDTALKWPTQPALLQKLFQAMMTTLSQWL